MSRPSIEIVRPFAMALPEAEESQHFGTPDFRVRGKIFATASLDGTRCVLKLPLHIQEAMMENEPDVFALPPGWGKHGWTFAQTDKIDPALLTDLLDLAWRTVAPKRLAPPAPPPPKDPDG